MCCFKHALIFPCAEDMCGKQLLCCTSTVLDLSATAYRQSSSLRAALQGRCGTPVTLGRLEDSLPPHYYSLLTRFRLKRPDL